MLTLTGNWLSYSWKICAVLLSGCTLALVLVGEVAHAPPIPYQDTMVIEFFLPHLL